MRVIADELGFPEHMPGTTASKSQQIQRFLEALRRRPHLHRRFLEIVRRERPLARLSSLRKFFGSTRPFANIVLETSQYPRGNIILIILMALVSMAGLASFAIVMLEDEVSPQRLVEHEACEIRCNACPDAQRAWIVLEAGGTYSITISGNSFTFRCAPNGARVSFVLEILDDGVVSLRATPYLEQGRIEEVFDEQFTDSLPENFKLPDTERKLTSNKRPANCSRKSKVSDCRIPCESGDFTACELLKEIVDTMTESGVPLEYEDACNRGDPVACREAGYWVAKGVGQQEGDPRLANEFYKKGCEQGDGPSCRYLGTIFDLGVGTKENDRKAILFYRLACNHYDAIGCNSLGILTENGLGVQANKTRAFELYRRACSMGYWTGCANLGTRYAEGIGVSENDWMANRYLKQACSNNEATACYALGKQARDGQGMRQNLRQARSLFRRACALGYKFACKPNYSRTSSFRSVPPPSPR